MTYGKATVNGLSELFADPLWRNSNAAHLFAAFFTLYATWLTHEAIRKRTRQGFLRRKIGILFVTFRCSRLLLTFLLRMPTLHRHYNLKLVNRPRFHFSLPTPLPPVPYRGCRDTRKKAIAVSHDSPKNSTSDGKLSVHSSFLFTMLFVRKVKEGVAKHRFFSAPCLCKS